jgi:hypothetical protein
LKFTVALLIEPTTDSILSYTAFLEGAIPVTQFQLLPYAVSLTAHAVAEAMLSSTYFFVAASVLFVGAGTIGLELNVFTHATV